MVESWVFSADVLLPLSPPASVVPVSPPTGLLRPKPLHKLESVPPMILNFCYSVRESHNNIWSSASWMFCFYFKTKFFFWFSSIVIVLSNLPRLFEATHRLGSPPHFPWSRFSFSRSLIFGRGLFFRWTSFGENSFSPRDFHTRGRRWTLRVSGRLTSHFADLWWTNSMI